MDHGNFLGILLLLAKYDPVPRAHLDTVIKESKRKRKSSSLQGQGSFTSLISKTTVDNILSEISKIVQVQIAQEVISAGFFSVQVDSTQDICTTDQLAIMVRYMTDTVCNLFMLIRFLSVNCYLCSYSILCYF